MGITLLGIREHQAGTTGFRGAAPDSSQMRTGWEAGSRRGFKELARQAPLSEPGDTDTSCPRQPWGNAAGSTVTWNQNHAQLPPSATHQ